MADSGEVIPNLDKPWEFLMARIHEWLAGIMIALICNEVLFSSTSMSMPLIISIMILSTYGLAMARLKFADGTRGLVNWCSVQMGIPPIGIPLPSALQPVWSGAPARRVDQRSLFAQLGFEEFFAEKKAQILEKEMQEEEEFLR